MTAPSKCPAVLVLGPGGLDVARRIADATGAELHGLARRVSDAAVAFDEAGDHLRALFRDGRPLICLCAAAIPIRLLAPLLADKRDEPPVIAVAEDGSAVVPLLGGHRGANALAETVADALGVHASVTTAGDVRFGAALDDPPPGWTLLDPEDAKPFAAALLAGASVRGARADLPAFLRDTALPCSPSGMLTISETISGTAGGETHLVYVPRSVSIGVGCERGTDPAELVALVRDTLRAENISERAVAGVFSLDLKADEPAVHAVAGMLHVPARFFAAATLEAETPRLATPSEVVFREVSCHGVSEGAALAAAGPDGELRIAKRRSARATCAIAVAPAPIDVSATGRPQGRLLVVGTGPGGDGWMTAESEAAVAAATDLVGYSLYLDLLGPRAQGKTRHDFPLGEETARVEKALDLAAEGRTVALVSSGDPGIYAMATLVFELLDAPENPLWARVAVEVCPGISALQAAAARSGAPLGHDFCTVSLSDLMTPWEAIERRVRAAADGDFVVAFYNPVSRRRTWQLAKAKEILLDARPETTPVVIARNLGRPEETVRVVTLRDLDPARIDMLTVVLVGSSETRALVRGDGRSRVYTPRGYGEKYSLGKKRESGT
jgi:cobalt-precorrin 5A hydrolase/precorrin-3B C17-methyltransferase